MRVIYGYELETPRGVYRSWKNENEDLYLTPEDARKSGQMLVDDWERHGKHLGDCGELIIVRVTVEDEDEYE